MQGRKFDFNWILLFIAIALGGIGAWATKNYFVAKEQEIRDELSRDDIVMADVVVAVKDLKKGDLISQENMSVRRIPSDMLPLDAVHPSMFDQVAGQLLLADMAPGRPLLSTYLPGHGSEQFSDLLKPGRRAVTIDIDENNSNAGMLVPADHIDLMLVFEDDTDEVTRSKLQLLIEDVLVLATGKRTLEVNPELVDTMFEAPDAYTTVTLDLELEDAARVMLAREKGKFVALLRNRKEEQEVLFQAINEDQLFGPTDELGYREVEMIVGGSGINVTKQQLPISNSLTQLSDNKNKNTL